MMMMEEKAMYTFDQSRSDLPLILSKSMEYFDTKGAFVVLLHSSPQTDRDQ